MKLKKITNWLFILFSLSCLIFEYKYYFNNISNLFSINSLHDLDLLPVIIISLTNILSYVFIFIYIIQTYKNRNFDYSNTLKFPIYYFLASFIFYHIRLILDNNIIISQIFKNNSALLIISNICTYILIVLIVYTYKYHKNGKESVIEKELTRGNRFFNYLIDLFIVLPFCLVYISTRAICKYSIFNTTLELNLTSIIYLNLFVYYLFFEVIFLQSIGKLHKNSYVKYSGSKLKSILIRSVCRFIPFNALSIFFTNPWHDTLSQTTVVNKIKYDFTNLNIKMYE